MVITPSVRTDQFKAIVDHGGLGEARPVPGIFQRPLLGRPYWADPAANTRPAAYAKAEGLI
jgi:hypothetical protein